MPPRRYPLSSRKGKKESPLAKKICLAAQEIDRANRLSKTIRRNLVNLVREGERSGWSEERVIRELVTAITQNAMTTFRALGEIRRAVARHLRDEGLK